MTFVRGTYKAERVVRAGTWVYGGEATCDVRIVYSPIHWGDGSEDESKLPTNVERDTFYLEYGSIEERGVFNVGGGGFPSVDEAMRHAETLLQGVKWKA